MKQVSNHVRVFP